MKETLIPICLIFALNNSLFAQDQSEASKENEKDQEIVVGVSAVSSIWMGDFKFAPGFGGSLYFEYSTKKVIEQLIVSGTFTIVPLQTSKSTPISFEYEESRYESTNWTNVSFEIGAKYLLKQRKLEKINFYLGGLFGLQNLVDNSTLGFFGFSFGATFGIEYMLPNSIMINISTLGKYVKFNQAVFNGVAGVLYNSYTNTVLGLNLSVGYYF